MSALFDLSGRRALVTGGAQGLGRMIAEGLLRAGASVTITSRTAQIGESAAADMRALGPCEAYASNLADPKAAIELAAQFASDHDRLDILINNAGRTWGAPLEQFPDSAWPAVLGINLQSPFALIRELLPMLRRGAGPQCPARIINIGSIAAMIPEGHQAYSYVASKAAIHQLSRELAGDLAPENITVNAIAPGYFTTRMTAHIRANEDANAALLNRVPLGRLGEGEDIAGLCIFLASRAGAYVTGAIIPVDGGLSGCG